MNNIPKFKVSKRGDVILPNEIKTWTCNKYSVLVVKLKGNFNVMTLFTTNNDLQG